MEKVLSQLTMPQFIQTVEEELKQLFNCERANIVLVDRIKKDIFRFLPLEKRKKGKNPIVSYPLETGIAGYVAVSIHSMFSVRLAEDTRFVQEIDDPLGEFPPQQMITCPVFARTDRLIFESADQSENGEAANEDEENKPPQMSPLSQFPRCVIQLIDKKDHRGFSQEDVSMLEGLTDYIGRCHDIITKVEQLHSLRSVSDTLLNTAGHINNNLSENMSNFNNLKRQLEELYAVTDFEQRQIDAARDPKK